MKQRKAIGNFTRGDIVYHSCEETNWEVKKTLVVSVTDNKVNTMTGQRFWSFSGAQISGKGLMAKRKEALKITNKMRKDK